MGKERRNDQPFIINLPPVRFAPSSRREHREKQAAFDFPCDLCVLYVERFFCQDLSWFLLMFLCFNPVLFRLSAVKIGFQTGNAIEKEYSVEVIQFMLDGDRFKATGFNDAQLPCTVGELHDNMFGPGDIAGIIGNAHAAFTHHLAAGLFDDLGVDHFEQPVIVVFAEFALRDIDDDDADQLAYLWSGNAHGMAGVVHGVDQVMNDGDSGLINRFNLYCDLLKYGVRI